MTEPSARTVDAATAWRDERVRLAARATVRIVALVGAAAAVWVARSVLLLGFAAIVLAVVLSFPVDWLQRLVRRRGIAVIAVLLLGGAAAGGLGTYVAPAVAQDFGAVVESAPRALERARAWLERGRSQRSARAGASGGPRTDGARAPAPPLAEAAESALGAAARAVGTVTEAVLVVVLAAFLVHEPDAYRRGLRALVPRRQESLFDELWTRFRHRLRRWVGGILVSMLIMGAVTAVGLLAAGIENWVFLGVLTFLGTFVPYLGAVVSAIPGVLVAAGQSPRHLLLAIAVYTGVHLVEGYLVQPLVMRRAVEIKPALLLAAQAIFGAVFGIPGIVVATPALVCLQAAVDHLWVERRLGKSPPAGAP